MRKLSAFLLLCFPIFASRQHNNKLIDSLLQQLVHSKVDTNKIRILDDLSFAYRTVDPDEGLRYASELKELADQLHSKRGVAGAYADIGINYQCKSVPAYALYYYFKSLALFDSLKDNKGISGNWANISTVYMNEGNYPQALEFAFKALKVYEESNNEINAASILGNIGNIYLYQRNYVKAIEYYKQAYKIHERIGDKVGVARTMGNIGIVQSELQQYPEALASHLRAYDLNKEVGSTNSQIINLTSIGLAYGHMNDYSRALDYQFKALNMSEQFNDRSNTAVTLGNIGDLYLTMFKEAAAGSGNHTTGNKKADLSNAIGYLARAVALCKKIQFTEPLLEFTEKLSEAYQLSGNSNEAIRYLKEYQVVKDSVYSVQSKVAIAAIEAKRDLELKGKDVLIKDKQVQITRLEAENKRNERILYISGITLLLVATGFLFRKYVRQRRFNRDLIVQREAHLDAIAAKHKALCEIAQMQSHDVRGPVASILGLVMLFNYDDPADPANKELMENINLAAHQLDDVIKKVVKTAEV